MYIAFLAVLVTWIIVLNILDALDLKEPTNADVTEKSELKGFIVDIMFVWGPAIVVLILSFIGGISFQDLGFRPIIYITTLGLQP